MRTHNQVSFFRLELSAEARRKRRMRACRRYHWLWRGLENSVEDGDRNSLQDKIKKTTITYRAQGKLATLRKQLIRVGDNTHRMKYNRANSSKFMHQEFSKRHELPQQIVRTVCAMYFVGQTSR